MTDANLWLGFLADGAELGGEVRLDRDLAHAALARLAERLGIDVDGVAQGIVRVADAEMTRALRVISVERGLDPHDFTLVAFGGAGGMHACALAEELGMTRIVVPRAGGVLSALGLAISDLRVDLVRPFLGALDEAGASVVDEAFEELEGLAAGQLDGGGADQGEAAFARNADLRYQGQSFELTVAAGGLADLRELDARFHVEHERRYGYRIEEEPIELVNLRVTATVPGRRPALREPVEPPAEPGAEEARAAARRRVNLDGSWQEVEVLKRDELRTGSKAEGPVVVEFPEATCVVRPGWEGVVDEVGNLVMEWRR